MRTTNSLWIGLLLACAGLLAGCGGGGNHHDMPQVRGVEVTNETSFVIERREFRLFGGEGWTEWVVEDHPVDGSLPDDTARVWSSDMGGPGLPPNWPTGEGYTSMHLRLWARGVVDGTLQEELYYEHTDLLFGEHLLAMSVRAYEFVTAP